jgi:hypothetical protein
VPFRPLVEVRAYARGEAGVTNAMSAKGQKQTLDCRPLMSALPPKADMAQHDRDVRFVPLADIGERLRMPLRMELPEGFDC